MDSSYFYFYYFFLLVCTQGVLTDSVLSPIIGRFQERKGCTQFDQSFWGLTKPAGTPKCVKDLQQYLLSEKWHVSQGSQVFRTNQWWTGKKLVTVITSFMGFHRIGSWWSFGNNVIPIQFPIVSDSGSTFGPRSGPIPNLQMSETGSEKQIKSNDHFNSGSVSVKSA